MHTDLWLKDRIRWLLNPTALANGSVAALATTYAWLTLQLSAENLRLFLIYVGAFGALFVVSAVARGLSKLKTLRGLASGRQDEDRESLMRALGEVQELPDRIAVLTVFGWFGTVGCVALCLSSFGAIDAPTVLRICGLGVLCAPISAALANLLVMRRARVVIEMIGRQLSAEDVIAALPATQLQGRARLVAITAALVILPSMMLVDVSRHQARTSVETVIAAAPALQAQVAAEQRWVMYGRLAMLVLMVLAAALVTAWASGSVMADPMRRVAAEANKMAQGELSDPQVFAASDEVWAVTSTFSLVQAQLQTVLAQLKSAGVSIASTTQDLVGTSTHYEAGAAEQASSLNETSATTEELAQSARQISLNASSVSEISQRTLDSAQAGQASAEAFGRAVERMRQDNRSIAEAVGRLQRKVQQIGKIVEFITGVADRSDLLALSAELEGTRAGDVGRSFTLVAAEMRRLAENVLESTTEIEELISEIREATQVTVEATERGLEQTSSGTALAVEVTRALAEVVRLAKETSVAARGITLATQQQQSGTDQLAEAMADILGITQQSLAATKQLTSANNGLVALSGSLSTLVERWKTG